MTNRQKKKKQKNFYKNSWFYQRTDEIIDLIDHVLSDGCLGKNSKRIAIILLANIYLINKTKTKLYTKRKSTIAKIQQFFIQEKDLRVSEIDELYKTLL